MVKNKVFSFLRGTPYSRFQDFAQIGVKSLVSLLNNLEKPLKIFQGIQDFYQEKKTLETQLFHLSKNEMYE